MLFKLEIFQLNLKNSSDIKYYFPRIPNIGQNISKRCILWAFICFIQEIWWLTQESGRFGPPTSFPGSLILPPGASEERPWLGLVTCYFDNWEHQGGVLCNQAVCRVEFCRAAAPRGEIANSIYSDVYLKVRQGCLEIFYLGRDVVAVVTIEYLWQSVIVQLWTSSSAIFFSEMMVNCRFSFEIARSDW